MFICNQASTRHPKRIQATACYPNAVLPPLNKIVSPRLREPKPKYAKFKIVRWLYLSCWCDLSPVAIPKHGREPQLAAVPTTLAKF